MVLSTHQSDIDDLADAIGLWGIVLAVGLSIVILGIAYLIVTL